MSIPSSSLSLPPKLQGNTRGNLELRVEALSFTKIKDRKIPAKVFVRWWGQTLNEGLYFSPRIVESLGVKRDSLPSNRGIRVAVYKVVTGKKRFEEYLQDAERLFLEVHCLDEKEETHVLGYSIIERLSRLIQLSSISEDLDVFDENGRLIGRLRCQLFYDRVDSDTDSCEASQTEPVQPISRIPTITLKSKNYPARQDSVLQEVGKFPTKDPNKPRVTFSDKNIECPTNDLQVNSQDLNLHERMNLVKVDQSNDQQVERSSSRKLATKTPTNSTSIKTKGSINTMSFSQPIDSDSDECENIDSEEEENIENRKSKQDIQESCHFREIESSGGQVKESEPIPRVSANFRSSGPNCKLKPEQVRQLLGVDQLVVHVEKIRLSEKFLANFLMANLHSRNDRRTGLKPDQKMSYFVKYSVPPRGEEINCCSIKHTATPHGSFSTKNKNVECLDHILFDNKSLHSVAFADVSTLETWLGQSLIFKVFSRTLNQRVPTYLGESSFALKYLLLSQRYSQGQEQKVPIYASKVLMRQMSDRTSEIIGDLFIRFNLEKQEGKKSQERITLTSRSVASKDAKCEARKFEKQVSKSDVVLQNELQTTQLTKNRQIVSRDSKTQQPKTILQTLLFITEGKNFSVRDPGIQNFFVSCRFLGTGDLLKSQICWNVSNPNFNFRHSIPIILNTEFLETCCKSNFLILEVWSYSQPKDKLVGVSTIPLHQIFVSYQDPNQRDIVLSLEYPVITTDGWLDVHNVLSGDVVGSIRTFFAVGREKQISNFNREPTKEKSSPMIPERSSAMPTNTESHRRVESGLNTSDECQQQVDLGTGTTTSTNDKRQVESSTNASTSTNEKRQVDSSTNTTTSANDNRQVDSSTNTTTSSIKATQTLPEPFHGISPSKSKSKSSTRKKSVQDRTVRLKVLIHEARNLPRIKSEDFNRRLPPNSYITLPNIGRPVATRLPVSKVVMESCCPRWNFNCNLQVPVDFFRDSRHHFIVKVWHCPLPNEEAPTSDSDKDHLPDMTPNFEYDPIIGFVAVDLKPLILHDGGFDRICGWYNIMDFVGRCRGQVKLTVDPISLECLHRQTFDLSDSDEETCSLHTNSESTTHRTVSNTKNRKSIFQHRPVLPPEPEKPKEVYWKPPEIDYDDTSSRSKLAAKMTDLADLAEKLKARLAGNTENPNFQPQTSFGDCKVFNSENVFGSSTKSSSERDEIASGPRNKIPQQFEIPRLVDLSDSEEQERRNELMTFSISGSESDAIPELAEINWDVVSPDSLREFQATKDQRRSRMAPDGGNPLEDKI